MTLEEKIKHFTTVTIENVQQRCDNQLSLHKAELDERFERHKEESKRVSELKEKNLKDAIERRTSKDYTMEQLHIKRKINHKQNELRDKVFSQVEATIKEYRKKPEYTQCLIENIHYVVGVAKGDELKVYIDSGDEHLKEELEEKCNIELQISDSNFGGGIRAEIPGRNILIDNTFATKLEEEKDKFLIV